MKVILCGGGDAKQTEEVNKLYASQINKDKPILYIPIAMEENKFPSCIEWIKDELMPYGLRKIEMITNIYSLKKYDLNEYSSIYIGGGNTYRLLYLLRNSGAIKLIQNFIENDGVVLGGSAGAIIFSKDIRCTDYADDNVVNLIDTKGFDIAEGYDICCHYTNRDTERNKYEFKCISDYVAKGNKVFALPEETSLFVEDNKVTVIGSVQCTLFTTDVTTLKPNTVYYLK
jgi:dipeptidase E